MKEAHNTLGTKGGKKTFGYCCSHCQLFGGAAAAHTVVGHSLTHSLTHSEKFRLYFKEPTTREFHSSTARLSGGLRPCNAAPAPAPFQDQLTRENDFRAHFAWSQFPCDD